MDFKLELVAEPVSDADSAKALLGVIMRADGLGEIDSDYSEPPRNAQVVGPSPNSGFTPLRHSGITVPSSRGNQVNSGPRSTSLEFRKKWLG
jgi:hypothetical protein